MDKQIAKIILDFLARVDLKGAETPVFMECISELNKLFEKKPSELPPKK